MIDKSVLKNYTQFLVVGLGALAVDTSVYGLLTRQLEMHYIAARTISLLLTFIWSYTVNRYWTFKKHAVGTGQSLIRFAVINGIAIVLNLIGMRIAVGIFHVYDLLALVCLSGAISMLSYIGHKRWSFQQ